MARHKNTALLNRLLLGAVFFVCLAAPLYAGPEDSPFFRLRSDHPADGHRGRINALALAAAETDMTETAGTGAATGAGANASTAGGGAYLLSAGEDGFLVIWDRLTLRAVERYQLSSLPVTLMKAHPARPEIAFVESDGFTTNRLRVINYWTKGELFTRDYAEPVDCIEYSPGGNFLVAAVESGVIQVLDARLGAEVRPSIRETAAYIAVSPTERTAAVYSPSGRISYWNLETGVQTAALTTSAFLSEPVIFRNYNLLAGRSNGEFIVINAINGRTVIRGGAVPAGMLFPAANDGGIACAGEDGVRVYEIGEGGTLETAGTFLFPAGGTGGVKVTAAIADTASSTEPAGFFLGFADGRILRLTARGGVFAPSGAESPRRRVAEALVNDGKLLFITEDGGRGESPIDFRAILAGNVVTLPAKPAAGQQPVSRETARFPVSALNGKLLYLTGDGPVIRSAENGATLFSIFLPLVIDADFADDRTIVTVSARSTGGSLLQLVNITTGETVPLDIPGTIALKVRRGKSGAVYAAVTTAVTGNTGGPVRILRLDLEYPGRSRRILERGDGGDDFSFAEAGEALVTNLGLRTAGFYDRNRGHSLFQGGRLPAFPARILDGGRGVIVIDGEGSILWLNPQNGQVDAVLRLFDDEWELSAASGERVRGR